MFPSSSVASPPEWDHGQRRQTIVEHLLKDILNGRLRPGQRLVTRTLSASLLVGQTPIREALITLTGIGVVEMRPNRGAVVRMLRPREVRDIYLVRRALECAAVRTACGRVGAEDLRSLAADIRELIGSAGTDRDRLIERARSIDNQLHDLIARDCGNIFLIDELDRLKLLYRAFRDSAYEKEGPLNNFLRKDVEAREHLAIVEAMLARDRGASVRAMSRHILSSIKYFGEISRLANP
jgi:DNA-binding GntR family transcriptional regulator